MSTRSIIAIEHSDCSETQYLSIYCHFDGYPSHVGEILKKFYDTTDKVKELLKLGDISYLDEDTGEAYAYHRDMKRDYSGPRTRKYSSLLQDDGVDYIYTFDGDYWECYKTGTRTNVKLY